MKNLVSISFKDVVKVVEKFYGKNLEVSVLFDEFLKHINTNKNYYKEKYEARFSECRRNIVGKLEEYIDRKIARIPASQQLATKEKFDHLDSSDYNS